MSAVRELTSALIAGGMDPADAAALVVRAGAELTVAVPSKAALRTRKWRAGKASQTVTGDDSVTIDETVTERHKPSPNVTGDDASLSLKEESNSVIKKKRESSRASQIPDGWRPSPEAWQETTVILGTVDRCEYELKKLKNHALEKGRVAKNWNAAWINWATRAVEYGGRTNGNAISTGAHPASNQSGSATIIAGVAAATERRARERNAARQHRPAPPNDYPAERTDPELFGTR